MGTQSVQIYVHDTRNCTVAEVIRRSRCIATNPGPLGSGGSDYRSFNKNSMNEHNMHVDQNRCDCQVSPNTSCRERMAVQT
jgi:hypothetical protein